MLLSTPCELERFFEAIEAFTGVGDERLESKVGVRPVIEERPILFHSFGMLFHGLVRLGQIVVSLDRPDSHQETVVVSEVVHESFEFDGGFVEPSKLQESPAQVLGARESQLVRIGPLPQPFDGFAEAGRTRFHQSQGQIVSVLIKAPVAEIPVDFVCYTVGRLPITVSGENVGV